MMKHAILDPQRIYRYSLTRRWGIGDPKRVVFVMLNPSTADAEQDDPTIRRCIGFAKLWGYDSIEVVNIYGYRATDPNELRKAFDPVGPDNIAACRNAFTFTDKIVAAWGANNLVLPFMYTHLFRPCAEKVYSLGLTKSGHPRHPLYVPYSTPLQPFRVPL